MSQQSATQQPIIVVAGPTASGKSALGIELALRFRGEVVNCDSVQVYREIEVATAKVSPAEQQGVPHHLLDFVSPERTYTAGDWARDAQRTIKEIDARGRLPIIVGGTGFYLRALRQPFFQSPPTDEALRQRLTRIRTTRGLAHLYKLLQRLDAASAARTGAQDWPRVQRALEVRLQTGKTLSAQLQERPPAPPLAARLRIIALNPPRAALYERINRRAETHFANGLVAEVRELMARGVPTESSALGAHGYRRVVETLRGERDLASAIEQTKLDVRHYAKRQLTWFRREPGVEWVDGFGDDEAVQQRVIEMVAAWLGHR